MHKYKWILIHELPDKPGIMFTWLVDPRITSITLGGGKFQDIYTRRLKIPSIKRSVSTYDGEYVKIITPYKQILKALL